MDSSPPVATGIFSWSSTERQTDRYGSFVVLDTTYDGKVHVEPTFDRARVDALVGKRVRITVQVTATRKSGHAGDQVAKIEPVTPDLGEIVDLGVGILGVDTNEWGAQEISLKPSPRRTRWWLDPHKLYRLHDQTVAVTVAETTDPFTPAAIPGYRLNEAIIANGDGTLQTKGYIAQDGLKIAPTIRRVRGMKGTFTLEAPPSHRGARLKRV